MQDGTDCLNQASIQIDDSAVVGHLARQPAPRPRRLRRRTDITLEPTAVKMIEMTVKERHQNLIQLLLGSE